MLIFRKIVKFLLTLVLVCYIGVSIYTQIKYEKYITTQKEEYHILQGRERISYKPAILYIIFDSAYLMRAGGLVYHGIEEKSVFAGRLYDGYIIQCYYDDNEIDEFMKNVNSSLIH